MMQKHSIARAVSGARWNPRDGLIGSDQGLWLDPSDITTMFQDAAGTTPVTAVEQPVGLMLDKSGRGNHAFQTVSTKQPVLSARVNQYLATETLATQNVTTRATGYTLRFSGAGTITLSGTATGVYSAGTHAITCTAGTLTSTVSGAVTQADLRPANTGVNLPAYQRVNTSTDYDTVGFPTYLKFDGIDDALQTNSIDFTATDKMTVWAGVRKLSDAAVAILTELSADTNSNAGAFWFAAPNNLNINGNYATLSRGSIASDSQQIAHSAVTLAPVTNVVSATHDIFGDLSRIRLNGAYSGINGPGDKGTGNFGNYPLYIGARSGSSLFFNGYLYQLVICGRPTTVPIDQITRTEEFVNRKTKAY